MYRVVSSRSDDTANANANPNQQATYNALLPVRRQGFQHLYRGVSTLPRAGDTKHYNTETRGKCLYCNAVHKLTTVMKTDLKRANATRREIFVLVQQDVKPDRPHVVFLLTIAAAAQRFSCTVSNSLTGTFPTCRGVM